MACNVVEALERINRLSEIALEFHGEFLGEVAANEVVGTALDLDNFIEEADEADTEEGDEDEDFSLPFEVVKY